MLSRRYVLGTALALGAGLAAGLADAQAKPPRLILLGTKGGPSLRGLVPLPFANLLLIEDVPYLVDTGYGTTRHLIEKNISLPTIRYVFLTHHHSDHNLEFGPVLYNAWANGLRTAVDAYGPLGLDALANGYWESNRFDIETRMADEGRPDLRRLVALHTYGEGIVMENAAVRVSALRNLHPPVMESYALKFELASGPTIVFSGDTTYFPPLAAFARGADYLVHEAMYGPAIEGLARRNPNAATLLEHLKAAHTLTDDVGRIADSAGVGTLVLSHFVPADDRSVTDEDWTAGVRAHFKGPVVVAKDGMEIPLQRRG